MRILSAIVNIPGRIRHHGFGWFLKRIQTEFRSPTFSATKPVAAALEAFRRLMRRSGRAVSPTEVTTDHLIAIYDLNVSSITFDFAYFLVCAEVFAKTHGKQTVFVWFVPKDEDICVDENYATVVDKNSQAWRFNQIVVPLVDLHSACVGYGVLPKDASIEPYLANGLVYPQGYSATFRPYMDYGDVMPALRSTPFQGLRATPQGLRYIERWQTHQGITAPIVTITLRQYGYDPVRNSNIAAWAKFAAWVAERGFVPVFVPDTDACWEPNELLKAFRIFREPCWNLGLRMALYESADLNFFYSNGTAALAQLNKRVRHIFLMPVIEDSLQAYGRVYDRYGLKVGQRHHDFAERHQWLWWKPDSFENICEAFLEFIEAEGAHHIAPLASTPLPESHSVPA